ncbi:MAG: glycoside hydrolase family 127 protein [Bacteroidales bacterium]
MKIINLSYFLLALLLLPACSGGDKQTASDEPVNLAVIADGFSNSRWGLQPSVWMNDGETPVEVDQRMRRFRPRRAEENAFVQYNWLKPVTTGEIALFLFDYDTALTIPENYRIKYWNGEDFVPVSNASGLGTENKTFNVTTFDPVETTILRIEVDSAVALRNNIVEWKVIKTADSPPVAPIADAGIDRSVLIGGNTYLSANSRSVNPVVEYSWKKISGPGKVKFDDSKSAVTTANFSKTGEYVLGLTAKSNGLSDKSELSVSVTNLPPQNRLDVVYTKNYSIDNQLWNDRSKSIIVNWIPHIIAQIERTDLESGQGGLDNFIEAAKALRGEPHGRHKGYVFSNAWVHQTIESMCLALMVDPKGDPEIMASQDLMLIKLEEWIPIILAAQEPDGYLQTAYTLRDTARWHNRWEERNRSAHEGYVSGYFIESAINHYTLTDGADTRLYDAAKNLADCWVANIGPEPGKIVWWDEHQEMEQALVRFGRFVNDMEGNGRGDSFIALSKFLLDSRSGGNEYSQSHVPVQQQYEAVGHAVRAVYSYSAMADIAAETADIDYQSAVMSLWDNMVNRKYYVTGGVGSGETSEGFGPDYSLRHNAYCESCSSCGLIFFQYKMNLAYHDAKYADLYEETMYNALLGSLDLDGKNFYYTNPMTTTGTRYDWHGCPCCVGNIPRTLLMVPTWTYVKGDEGLYVNLFIGSTINVEDVMGSDIEMVQETEYPWDGKVSITVNPAEDKEFTLFIREPNRNTSEIYNSVPEVSGLSEITVNGETFTTTTVNGYAEIHRNWKAGDVVSFEIPMEVQKVTAIDEVEATRDQVALRYGPIVYNVETVDQPDITQPVGSATITSKWNPDLLNGVITLHGEWADGTPLTAIPYFTRQNRDGDPDPQRYGRSMVWMKMD